MRELNEQEVEEVSGGLSLSASGGMILGIGIASLGGPVGLGAFAVGLGVTLMVGGTGMEAGYCD
ncbi:MAG: lactobin A/cerein 7B family class IIb bacteriocin [Crocinitomicaceae bacterium]|jgi:lactobin A/cerein 7B family class IIb bacteriocin